MGNQLPRNIAGVAQDVSAQIERICFDEGDWHTAAEIIGAAFPETFVAIINANLKKGEMQYSATYNIEEEFYNSYKDYYAGCNPWNETWMSIRGNILITEDISPASTFKNSEFYNDWMGPQKVFDAGAGMQIHSRPDELIYVSIHYNPAVHASYGPALESLYTHLSGNFHRTLRLAQMRSKVAEQSAAKGALVDHFDQAALVVSNELQVRDANEFAVDEFKAGIFFSDVGGRFTMRDPSHQRRMSDAVRNLLGGNPDAHSTLYFRTDRTAWIAHLAIVRPIIDNALLRLCPPAPQVLLVLRDIHKVVEVPQEFATLYGLTPSEQRLCGYLASGKSLAEAAHLLSVTENTVRERVKRVFSKTATNRQAELVRLILMFV